MNFWCGEMLTQPFTMAQLTWQFGRNAKTSANIEYRIEPKAFNQSTPMIIPTRSFIVVLILTFVVGIGQLQTAAAQNPASIDDENDPVKLFERGQDAHAKSDYKTAI